MTHAHANHKRHNDRANACGYIISDTQRLPTYNGNNVRNHVLPGASSGALGECQAARKDARQPVGCSDGQGPGGPDHAPHWIGIIQCGGRQAFGPRGSAGVPGVDPGSGGRDSVDPSEFTPMCRPMCLPIGPVCVIP